MKKIITIFLLVNLLVATLHSNVFATENNDYKTEDNEVLQLDTAIQEEKQNYDDTEFKTQSISARTPDKYEPNDTKETAYSYDSIPVINNSISMEGSLYTLGYKSANLTNANDVDWYKVNLNQDTTIFADLRNLGNANYNMRVYYTDANGKEWYYSTEKQVFNGKPEKYINFKAPITGTYYVKIYSLGDDGTSNYYFYIGPKYKRTFYITNLQLPGTQIWGTDYIGSLVDMKNYFPKTATIRHISLSNKVSGKNVVLDKKIQIGTKSYYSQDGSEEIYGMTGVSLYDVYYFAAKGSKNVGYWVPEVNGSFFCDMNPYPGNEVE